MAEAISERRAVVLTIDCGTTLQHTVDHVTFLVRCEDPDPGPVKEPTRVQPNGPDVMLVDFFELAARVLDTDLDDAEAVAQLDRDLPNEVSFATIRDPE